MKAKIREILEECIELGIERGHMSAHKHHPDPPNNHIFSQIEHAIWIEIDQRFDFEQCVARNVCDEVVEGFDELEKGREWVGLTEVEIRYALREWADTGQTVKEMLYAIEDKLKEKNA